MKKIFVATIVASLMSMSAVAGTLATVKSVNQYASGGTSLTFINEGSTSETAQITLVGAENAIKSMIAIALTAKTSGATVEYNVVQYQGAWGLGQLFLK
ncbi:MAG: hypothetical protein COB07_12920 [Sulfurovum sp.]|nr:MAG: hypothetical protein COB07_12920 [Sulfurovum sp.]